jgi:hypothetical protein
MQARRGAFTQYLATGQLHVDVWDGSSLLQHGVASIDLAGLLRQGLSDIARHVTGCHLAQYMRDSYVLDILAGNGPGLYFSPCHRMPLNRGI